MALKDVIMDLKFVACKYSVMRLTYFCKFEVGIVRGQAMACVLWQLLHVSGVDCLFTAQALNHM